MAANGRHKGSAGFLTNEHIGIMPKAIDASVIERFKKLADLTGTVSDYLDVKGVRGTIGASQLRPTIDGRTVVGRAITVRNTPQPLDPHLALTQNSNLMSEVEGINQAEPGDVLVIQGLPEISNMGGIMATVATRQGIAGAVVDGGIRDVGHSRRLGLPIWSRDVTPVTGKWRAATQQINGVVNIMGVSVAPGDLVIADETGVCFVPQTHIMEVLELCEAAASKEDEWVQRLDAGMSIPDLVRKIYQNFPHQGK